MRTLAFLIVFVLLAGLHKSASGQIVTKDMPWVSVVEYQLPWSHVDSLQKLRKAYDLKYKWEEKAVELGHVLDIRIYFTNDVWNCRMEWLYPSWEAMMNPGWVLRTWEEVLPDSVKHEDIAAGYDWVFKDVVSRWRAYRLVTGAR
jgi:hypothetical protein